MTYDKGKNYLLTSQFWPIYVTDSLDELKGFSNLLKDNKFLDEFTKIEEFQRSSKNYYVVSALKLLPALAVNTDIPDIEGQINGTQRITENTIEEDLKKCVSLQEFASLFFYRGIENRNKNITITKFAKGLQNQEIELPKGYLKHEEKIDFNSISNQYYEALVEEVLVQSDIESKKIKLVVGEDHYDKDATGFIRQNLDKLAEAKTPIFLEFLQFELWQPILNQYYSTEGDKKDKIEEFIGEMLHNIKREPNIPIINEGSVFGKLTHNFFSGQESGELVQKQSDPRPFQLNQDLFDLIKEARKKNVRIYPAETVASHHQTSHPLEGSNNFRLPIANFAAMDIVKKISPDNFVVLIGNQHLISSEKESRLTGSFWDVGVPEVNDVKKPALPKMLGAKSIAFCKARSGNSPIDQESNETREKIKKECDRLFSKLEDASPNLLGDLFNLSREDEEYPSASANIFDVKALVTKEAKNTIS